MMMKDDSVVIKCNGIERSNVNNSLSMARETCALFVRFLVISIAPPAWYDDNAKKERPSETRDETSTYTRPLSSKKKKEIYVPRRNEVHSHTSTQGARWHKSTLSINLILCRGGQASYACTPTSSEARVIHSRRLRASDWRT